MITIKCPIWNSNGKRCVGIAEYKIGLRETKLEILYVDKFGRRLFPHVYRMDTQKMKTYPIKETHGVKLRIVPIEDFEVVGDIQEGLPSLSAAAA